MALKPVIERVTALTVEHQDKWRDKAQSYWLQRLMQEVGELASVMAGDHSDTMEHELEQIASICLNWLDSRDNMEIYRALVESELTKQ